MYTHSPIFLAVTLLAALAAAQPAYRSSSKNPWEYEMNLVKENVVCRLSTGDCFHVPDKGNHSIFKNATVASMGKTDSGFVVALKNDRWQANITMTYLQGLSWHQSQCTAAVKISGKAVTFRRAIAHSPPSTTYLYHSTNLTVVGAVVNKKKCFSPSKGYTTVSASGNSVYLFRRGYYFALGVCKLRANKKGESVAVYVASSNYQQPAAPDFILASHILSTMKVYKQEDFHQVVFAFYQQQYTFDTSSCQLIQTYSGGKVPKSKSNRRLVIGSGKGTKGQTTTGLALLKIPATGAHVGVNQYFAHCIERSGVYLDARHHKISVPGAIFEDKRRMVIYVDLTSTNATTTKRPSTSSSGPKSSKPHKTSSPPKPSPSSSTSSKPTLPPIYNPRP